MDNRKIVALYFIWNADWSFSDWLLELKNLIMGVKVCSLCNIAYQGLGKKKSWKDLENDLEDQGIEPNTMYRNQAKKMFQYLDDNKFPLVISVYDNGCSEVFINADQISSFHGDVTSFKDFLFKKLDSSN